MRRKNGEIFFTEHTVMPIEDDQGGRIGWVSVVRDITERKQVEEELRHSSEQLRSLTTRLQTVREEERGRIAREIHDELGQVLTGLKMDLSWLAGRLLKNQKPLLKKTKSMSELVDATIQTVRKISSELRPGILDDLGLSAAIEWQAQEFENRTGIKCRFISSREDFRLDKERSTAVFRLFQETLTNVARHAEATRVDIELEERAGHLILKVHDNGKGITRRQISHSKSLGLLGMRERALLFEGEVEIKGIRGKGTTVTVQIPTGKEEAEGSQRKGEGKRERGRTPKRRIAGKRG
jgi:signal transduction histidine kinase